MRKYETFNMAEQVITLFSCYFSIEYEPSGFHTYRLIELFLRFRTKELFKSNRPSFWIANSIRKRRNYDITKMSVWDSKPQEKYVNVLFSYFRGACCCCIELLSYNDFRQSKELISIRSAHSPVMFQFEVEFSQESSKRWKCNAP